MADDTIHHRMATIEARLEGIETELTKLTELVSDAFAEARKTRDEVRLLTGLVNSLATTVQALTEYIQALGSRVDRLESGA